MNSYRRKHFLLNKLFFLIFLHYIYLYVYKTMTPITVFLFYLAAIFNAWPWNLIILLKIQILELRCWMFMQRFKNTSNMQIFNSFYFKHLKWKFKKTGTVHGAYFKVPISASNSLTMWQCHFHFKGLGVTQIVLQIFCELYWKTTLSNKRSGIFCHEMLNKFETVKMFYRKTEMISYHLFSVISLFPQIISSFCKILCLQLEEQFISFTLIVLFKAMCSERNWANMLVFLLRFLSEIL